MKSFCLFIMLLSSPLFIFCDKSMHVSPGNDEICSVQIIAPSRMRTGEYLPVVVRVLNESGELDYHATLTATLKTSNNVSVSIKKGVGSQTSRIDANHDFDLEVSGCCVKRSVSIIDSIEIKEVSGILDGNYRTWDNSADYHITGDLIVPQGMTLTIDQGARIFINAKVNIVVNGCIAVNGTFESPVLFISMAWEDSWGGIEIRNSNSYFMYSFFVNGGADDSRSFGHSNSQPVIYSENSKVIMDDCFLIDNPGKALGTLESTFEMKRSLISRCDTGGEFRNTYLQAYHNHIIDIPNGDGVEVDDDNDGFYVVGIYNGSQKASGIYDCVFMTGKDDAIDHNDTRLDIGYCWIEDFAHEGIATSNGYGVFIVSSVIKNCQQGIEAGYGSPQVVVDHCVLVDNEVGIRFGDSYTRESTGHMEITNCILYGNDDNVLNYEPQLQSAVAGAIEIFYTMTNDSAYDDCPYCITGVPLFDEDYYLLASSPGRGQGMNGNDMGLTHK
ncbi:right-handed parallel beta-helix repeat-containing protein [bacterium]|nr:right-handed parallel beta-helix repeat-containing protein [bacterium]